MPVAREQVTFRDYNVDGELIMERVRERNVHRPRDGRPYVRHRECKTYLTQVQPPVVEVRAHPVADGSFAATIAPAITRAADAGLPIRVVGLF